MTPRPYQVAAIEALDHALYTTDKNPCVVIPTGGGKSPIMAWTLERYLQETPTFRAIILAHRKELVAQNAAEMLNIWPGAPVGVYAAGMKRREAGYALTFASIDSVHRKGSDFAPFDLIVVDEAHRIPMKGEGKYRRFIADCKTQNPRLRVVGFTATPFRMGIGPICHRDHILTQVCYEANVCDLIHDGYLSHLRSKISEIAPDVSGVAKRGGEYVSHELAKAVDREQLITDTVASAVQILRTASRKSVLWFCVDVNHCKHVAAELRRHGRRAEALVGTTQIHTRDRIASRFLDGDIEDICNVDVLTEGFNAKRIDAIVLLRPTESPGLYAQMVGRGLRLFPGKTDCLVLDFAHCIDTHGPIDVIAGGETKMETCRECAEVFSRAIGACPQCGWEVPKITLDLGEIAARERRLHDSRASDRSILSDDHTETLSVDTVMATRHHKGDKPDSIKVTYCVGISRVTEWICLDHPGYAGHKAASWWTRRFGLPVPSVDEALQDLFLGHKIAAVTESLVICRPTGKKYAEIQRAVLRTNNR